MTKLLKDVCLDDGWEKIAEYDETKLYRKSENGSYFLYSISEEDGLIFETKIEEKPILGFDIIPDNKKPF